MNILDEDKLNKANEVLIYNLYLYQATKNIKDKGKKLGHIIDNNDNVFNRAVKRNSTLLNTIIKEFECTSDGMCAAVFENNFGEIIFTFKGTGDGEWIDNGEGLSGMPDKNTYITYENNKSVIKQVYQDFSTNQQVQALNWFNEICNKNGWNNNNKIIVSGHSKGGNKAQYITISSDLVDECYSFSGQGFSPEAINYFKSIHRDFDANRQKIHSFSSYNDYVNVLGIPIVPFNNIHYFFSTNNFHSLESIIDNNGSFFEPCEQGRLSEYVSNVSYEIMNLQPEIRKYTTLGIMNIFQKYLGKGTPVNNDNVTIEETIAGIAISILPLIRGFDT